MTGKHYYIIATPTGGASVAIGHEARGKKILIDLGTCPVSERAEYDFICDAFDRAALIDANNTIYAQEREDEILQLKALRDERNSHPRHSEAWEDCDYRLACRMQFSKITHKDLDRED